MVLDTGGSESSCSDWAVGADGWWLWNAIPTGRHDGQRSRPRASRRNGLHAPPPGLAILFFQVIEGQNKALHQLVRCAAHW
jgi:hypothetical protein